MNVFQKLEMRRCGATPAFSPAHLNCLRLTRRQPQPCNAQRRTTFPLCVKVKLCRVVLVAVLCCSACCRWSFPNFGKQFQGSRQIRKLLLLGPDVRVPRLVDKSSKQWTMKDSIHRIHSPAGPQNFPHGVSEIFPWPGLPRLSA